MIFILKILKTQFYNIFLNNLVNFSINDNDFQPFKKTVKLGRKKKGSFGKGIYNKYTLDNIIRKCKVVLINKLRNFINNIFILIKI